MITENDIKELRLHKTRSGKICNWIFIIFPIFLSLIGFLNLYIASRIGNKIGYNFLTLFQSWLKGVDMRSQYSGIYIKAMERLSTSLLQFGVAFIVLIFAYGYQKRCKMNQRIYETLKQNGLIKS